MSTISAQATARIYQFPLKSRVLSRCLRVDAPQSREERAPYPAVESGAGWYHEAAIREAERCGKP